MDPVTDGAGAAGLETSTVAALATGDVSTY
jgi:hypothetical protein